MTYSSDPADNHLQISRRFIRQADEELANDDHIQASEKAWGAVAHRLISLAISRGWRHGGHRDFYVIIRHLEAEMADAEMLSELFRAADSLHANFYTDYFTVQRVQEKIEDSKRLLTMLEEYV